MRLYEYMAKDVLARAGIRTPRGRLVSTPQQAADACTELGPVVLKAQVLAGGRGKAGGVKFAANPAEAADVASSLLGAIVGGTPVERVLCEQRIDVARELYVGIAVDGAARKPVLIVSNQGGVGIEEVPEKNIVRRHIGLPWGLFAFTTREVVRRLGIEGKAAVSVVDVILRMYRVFRRHDAELVEINPLALLADETAVALDGRLNVDDDALWRQRDLPAVSEDSDLERRIGELGLAYVELDGDIAVLANGAGMAMATLDILYRYGGRPANFMDAGGGAGVESTAKALELLLSRNPKVLLVNVFGGITRCDEVAAAIVRVKNELGPGLGVPLVVRLAGTNEAEGMALLERAGVQAFRSMEEAAARAVALAGGGTA